MSDSGYAVLGKRIPRVDGIVKTKGEAAYVADLFLPGMLMGKILRSPFPHAKILRIDTSRAERLKGVKAVITGKDIPDVKYGYMMLSSPDTADRYFLARERVKFIGDEVAAVAAISENIAEEALELIKVEYEELPAVLTMDEALKPGAPLICDNFPGNINTQTLMNFGDVEKGFQESDYVREDNFMTPLQQHCFMEPHVSIGDFNSSGKITLWSSTQSPFLSKLLLSKLMGLPLAQVRVIKPHMGGGFGGKGGLYPLDLSSALLSRKSGKPVRICYTREEEFAASCRRHPVKIALKIGVKKDGTIMARQAKIILDGGAYNSLGPVVTFLAVLWMSHLYRQPNIKFEGCRVYTNNSPCTPMRGFASPQSYLASEIQLDIVAEALGIDPIELRIKNALQTGDQTVNGFHISSSGLRECLQRVEEGSEWKNKYKKLPFLKGIGVASGGLFCGNQIPLLGPHTASSTIFIKANIDGTVGIASGVSDIGQGSDTVLSMIAAEELGIKVDDVRISSVDTDTSPPDLITVSARCTYQAGNAAKRAAADLKQKLFQAVAGKMEVSAKDLEAKDGRIYVKGSSDRGVTFAEAIVFAQMANKGATVVGEGSWNPDPKDQAELNMVTGYGSFSPGYTFGALVAEVEVDKETGMVRTEKLLHSHDCGKVLNLLGVEGQAGGASSMGLGFALLEGIQVENGKTLNPGFLEYKLPTSIDMPQMATIFVETNDPGGPFGAKEGAEGLVGPIAPAILNAIYDATGIRFKELPVTPEMMLKELKKKEGDVFMKGVAS